MALRHDMAPRDSGLSDAMVAATTKNARTAPSAVPPTSNLFTLLRDRRPLPMTHDGARCGLEATVVLLRSTSGGRYGPISAGHPRDLRCLSAAARKKDPMLNPTSRRIVRRLRMLGCRAGAAAAATALVSLAAGCTTPPPAPPAPAQKPVTLPVTAPAETGPCAPDRLVRCVPGLA